MSKPFVLGFLVALICILPLHAQTATNPPPDPNAKAANAQLPGQAPDETTKKITELVHAGKYAEAQQLTTGLLVAYPNDQRLIKAKALIEKLIAPAGSVNTGPSSSQPTNAVAPAQPKLNTSGESLTGMERVDYNALVELARQAQQTADLPQQKTLLQQFMDQSGLFVQKHPDQTLLWQLRVASALSLNDPMAGYEAGQRLLAAGASDSNDPHLQRLLSQLKNKGWLDKQSAEKHAKYDWIVGTWRVKWSVAWRRGPSHGDIIGGFMGYSLNGDFWERNGLDEQFSMSGSVIEGYNVSDSGVRSPEPDMRGTVLDSGEIRWERLYSSSEDESRLTSHYVQHQPKPGTKFYPFGYVPVISCAVGNDKRTMTMVIPSQHTSPSSKNSMKDTQTLLFTRVGSTQ